MRDYNKVILMGHMVQNPELKNLNGGKQVVNFTVAVNRKWTGPEGQAAEEVSYIDCQSWGKQGKTIADYFSKGSPIFLEGRLRQDTWEKDGKKHSRLRVVVENFSFIDSKKPSGSIPTCAGNACAGSTGEGAGGNNGEMTDSDFDALQ